MGLRLELREGGPLYADRHAVLRFRDRVCPALDIAGAAANLQRLAAAVGEMVAERPAWMNEEREPTSCYLLLGPDVALPVKGAKVTTCIVPAPSDKTLAERSELRRSRAAVRRRRRAKGSQAGEGNAVYGRRGASYRKRNGREEQQR